MTATMSSPSTLTSRTTRFVPVRASLRELLGDEYVEAVAGAHAILNGGSAKDALAGAGSVVELLPESFLKHQVALLGFVGTRVTQPLAHSAAGATTEKFAAATRRALAPISAAGVFRIGEDGRLHLTTKSEHYHVPLGHSFPGWRLLELARAMGIPNATHNNTRGHITRLLEERLIGAANGVSDGAGKQISRLIDSDDPATINRVLNLETGSLAMEAAIKLVMGRFYRLQADQKAPKYAGRLPVLVVIGNERGELIANYHGTTVLAQMMRGMWSDVRTGIENEGLLRIRAVRANNIADLERVFGENEAGGNKIGGLFLELVLMNYGALALRPEFVARIAALCSEHDVPVVVDEIQTGLWSPELLMCREYELQPAIIGLGKGFPGGEYAASRLLFAGGLDVLPQFGALVTNGQEELASLAYLIAMRWAAANASTTAAVGGYYEERVRELSSRHATIVRAVEGRRHLLGVHFHDLPQAQSFVRSAEAAGLDISVQTYKTSVSPVALTKLPLIAGYEIVDLVVQKMEAALRTLKG